MSRIAGGSEQFFAGVKNPRLYCSKYFCYFSGPEINMNVIHVKSYRHFCNKIWQGFSLANSKLGTTFKPNSNFRVSF